MHGPPCPIDPMTTPAAGHRMHQRMHRMQQQRPEFGCRSPAVGGTRALHAALSAHPTARDPAGPVLAARRKNLRAAMGRWD
jgi:hypothetical protein